MSVAVKPRAKAKSGEPETQSLESESSQKLLFYILDKIDRLDEKYDRKTDRIYYILITLLVAVISILIKTFL